MLTGKPGKQTDEQVQSREPDILLGDVQDAIGWGQWAFRPGEK